ncbi:CNNM domain-containing protein [Gracilimonas mengyeensis]|uniref:Hemolysin, contains CBS domains n=1 Tax=Gracilimonas mengyeensis TaxID=1302730 RepID=A0A521ER51_9BACT|nr:hemolysin family protein [Gracilimonas mengyeensis]SMO85891.1 Hemolysin, contains CBS domains [Gracilimonas mengyeensis]
MELTIRLLSGVILLLLNAFYVTSEFALTRLRQYKREELGEGRGLDRAWEMTKKLEIYLTSCQIGITTTSILLGVIAEPAVTELIQLLFTTETIGGISTHVISITLSVVLINFVHTVWGEQAPTYLGVERAKSVAKYTASPLYWWTYAIYPVLVLGDWITKATLRVFNIHMERSWLGEDSDASSSGDIRSKMVELLRSGNLEDERQKEVLNALDIDQIPVEDIMITRDKIVTLSTEKSFQENLKVINQHMHTRYPLVGESIDDFIGILYTPQITANTKELLEGTKKLDDFDWSRLLVPKEMAVSDLIDRFQAEQQELALVEENDRIIGLVTLTDALEAIIGSAEDPLDKLEEK